MPGQPAAGCLRGGVPGVPGQVRGAVERPLPRNRLLVGAQLPCLSGPASSNTRWHRACGSCASCRRRCCGQIKLANQILAEEKHVPMYKVRNVLTRLSVRLGCGPWRRAAASHLAHVLSIWAGGRRQA